MYCLKVMCTLWAVQTVSIFSSMIVFSVAYICVRNILRLMFFCGVMLNVPCSVMGLAWQLQAAGVRIVWQAAPALIFVVLFGDAPNKTCFYNLLFSVQQPGTYIDNWCYADVKTDWFKKSLSSSHPLIGSPRFTYDCVCLLCLERNKLIQ